MEDIKNNARLIADAHNRQINEISEERDQMELEKRRVEIVFNRVQKQFLDSTQ
jgi:hypothetical protein